MMDKVYTVKEAGKVLKISPGTLSNWRICGRGPAFIKAGSRILYKEGDLQEFLNNRRIRTQDSN